MSDSANGLQINGNNESTSVETIQTESSKVTPVMDSVNGQQSQTQTTQQSSQLLIGQQVQQMPTIEVSTTDQNQLTERSVQSCSSANSGANVSIGGSIISSNHSEPLNVSSVMSTSLPSVVVSTGISGQGSSQTQTSQSQQLIVSSSQPQMVSTSQSGHLNMTNAIMAQSLTGTQSMTSGANATTVQIAHQSPHHAPIIHTSVQPTQHNPMSVAMSQLPQVQVIQQPLGSNPTYQFQQVYPQQMILPGNLIGNMQFSTGNQGLSLQIPFTASNAVSSGTITGIAAKPPIMSKGVAISPLTQGIATSQHHMISSLKPNIAANGPQILKQVLPAQQFVPHSTNQTVVISQLMPHQAQHSMQPSLLPANTNRTLIDTPKGKPFGTHYVRSSFGNKMLSHSGTIQPKSPILPASSSSLINSHFKSPFPTSGNTTQLIATQTPGLITNSPQILGSFPQLPQGLTWTTAPQSAHLVAPNGSPIFIRTPGQSGEHMFIQTSSPQIQTLSMATPMNVHSSGTTMHMNAVHTQSTPITATLQPISVASHMNTTTTTTVANTIQPTAIAPSPMTTTPNKQRLLRPASSVATQTAAPSIAQKQQAESSTSTPIPPKPIAPAKPKPNSQTATTSSKLVNKEQNASAPVRTTSVAATTQTISQQTHQPSTKSDAANQTTKVSVGTETPKTNNNQVSSSRNSISDAKHSSVKSNNSTNTTTITELSQPKVNSVAEEVKSTPAKRHVEKKDASTGQDSDLLATYFAQQHNHQSVQISAQITSNNVSQQNGQIAVLADLNRQDISKQPPQKAIVKPQILTHVIDGYIIQESPSPFPVNGLNYTSDQKSFNDDKNNGIVAIDAIKSLKNKNENSLNTNASSSVRNRSGSEPLCLNCGSKRKISSKSNKKSKRFCSSSCAEKHKNNDKNSTTTRLGLFNSVTSHLENNELQRGQEFSVESSLNESEKPTHEERKRSKSTKNLTTILVICSTKNGDVAVVNSNQRKSTTSDAVIDKAIPSVNLDSQSPRVADEASSSSAVAGLFIPPGGKNPLKWSVQDVYEFVRNLQGCTEYADEFRSQEIDGQALMLLKEDHLMSAMNMKLGPALKICNKINALREDVQKQN